MRKKINAVLMASVCALALSSCSITSTAVLNDLRNISTDINQNGSTYGISEWKSVGEKYYKTNKKIAYFTEKNKYSNEEIQEIGRLQGECVSGFAKGAGTNIANKVSTAKDFINSILDGFQNNMKKE